MGGGARRIAADSSSIILLQKASLLENLLFSYQVAISEIVYVELTQVNKKGSAGLQQLLKSRITEAGNSCIPQVMGKGESSIIGLFVAGMCDFVLLDDRRAANYCRVQNIPFVNSLLISRILNSSGIISSEKHQTSTAILLQEGYYSGTIVARAKAFSDSELRCFHPN